MGTWSTSHFGNDAALDWVGELSKAVDDSYIVKTLDRILEPAEPPGASACEAAIACAALIGKAAQEPLGKLSPTPGHGYAPRASRPPPPLLKRRFTLWRPY